MNEPELTNKSDYHRFRYDMGIDGKYCGVVLLLPEVFKTSSIVKCYYTKHKYISIFQVMPITKEYRGNNTEVNDLWKLHL